MSEPLSISEALSTAARAIVRLEPDFYKPSMDELMEPANGYSWIKNDGLIFSPKDWEEFDGFLLCLSFAHHNIKRMLMVSFNSVAHSSSTHAVVGVQFAVRFDGEDFLCTNNPSALRLAARMLVRLKRPDES